jgi:AcrR family transcriptional regulator
MNAQRPGLRERKNERTRAAITRAALELTLEMGFERATITQIAERADVSPRTVHAWFRSKEDIVIGAEDLRVDRLAVELADGEGDTLDRVRRWIEVEGALRAEPDELSRLRHRVLLADPHLRTVQRGRQEAVEALIAAAVADEAGLPRDAIAPRALAAAVITTLLALQERFAADSDTTAEGFEGAQAMLRAALVALRDRDRSGGQPSRPRPGPTRGDARSR